MAVTDEKPVEPQIESASPALCRVMLAVELRKFRIAAGLTAAQVARTLSCAPSKLTRLETADSGIVQPADVMALCSIYQVPEEDTRVMVGYATVTKTKRDWFQRQDIRDAVPPGFMAYLGLEAVAESLENYENEFVPGLLQTEAYIRSILARTNAGFSAAEIDRRVSVRITRQEVLHRSTHPLELTAVLNEAVLRRRVGSPEVMRDQFAHIINLVKTTPNVKVQVVPFDLGTHPGMNGAFTLLRLPDPLRPIVYLENLTGAGVSRREPDVRSYESAFSDLQALAPGYEESLSMIENAIKEFK
ncbi:helix-turn-helix domain-containing protein [Streptomyces sp. NPDC087440]|uniref:helix-turn-helix domain-containing protein n=1 Tax=Streptomyces sp. NPDC087440 TaxID=3365790 RepID=UPI0038210E77